MLSSATSGATIYYTTDGSTPSQSSTQYRSGITVSSTTTINAIAYAGGMATSAISTGVFTIGSGSGGAAWYNSGWSYRKQITISPSLIAGTLPYFPVLISLPSDSNLAHGGAQSNGNDILFTDSSGTNKLNHEIEMFVSSTGQLIAWVQVPSLSSSNNILYMYYGNSSVGPQQNQTGTWNSNYMGVYHLTAASTAGLADSTSYANSASNPTGGFNTASGPFGGGSIQNPGNYWAYLDIPGQTYNELGGGSGTVSVWAYATAADSYSNLAQKGSNRDFALLIPFGGGGGYIEWGGQGNYTSGISLSTNTWYYVTLTMNASTNTLTLYINGVAQNTLTLSGYTGQTGDIEMFSGYGNNYLTGYETEFRMSNVALSSSWITTEYNNQSSPSNFYSVGPQQPQGGGSYPTPVGMPTLDPAPGTYNTPVSVTLASNTSGASIHYTTNGSTPSETAGTLYSGAFTVNTTTTVKAIAYANGMADSEISTMTFTISSSSGGSNYLTYYTYDGFNNLTQVSMPRPTGTQTRTFTYSGKYLTSATNPENGTVNYTYNSYMKVATKTDAKGQAIVYSYDSIARLIEVQKYPNGTSGNEDTCQRELYYYGDVEGGNPWNTNYSQYASGRLSGVQYYTATPQGGGCATVQEQYSYLQAGAKTNKGLVITRSTGAVDLESSYTYDNEGKMLTEQYPGSSNGSAGPSLTYAYDSMGRLNTLTDVGNSVNVITSTTYDPANRLLQISGNAYNETRSYNTMGQLTGLTVNNSVNTTYTYSSNQNNGKIISQTDGISGETVQYAYDALNRLASAAATSGAWGQSYGYDGFGNLTDQTVTAGTAPSLTTTYNASTNQQAGDCADANGNISPCGTGMGYSYDVKNRIVWVPGGTPYGTAYGYAPNGKRIWRGAENIVNGSFQVTLDEITFWGVNGKKLATYNLSFSSSPVSYSIATSNYYFGRKLVKNGSGYVGADRLGSIGHFYPWGQEKPSATQNGTEKFTGYFRDAETNNDYAVNRYHQPGMGRFLSPDPYKATGTGASYPTNPGSWNKYAYVVGDPINLTDRNGKDCEAVGARGNEDPCGPPECDPCDPNDDCYDPGLDCGGPPKQPSQPQQPTCSITVFTRGVPFPGSPAQHTYIEVTDSDSSSGIGPFGEVLEGGPSNPHPFWKHQSYGNLVSYEEQVPSSSAGVVKGTFLGGTNPYTNTKLGTETGQDTCADVFALLDAISNYDSGSGVAYAPVPNGTSTFNSNSFTYTLLQDIGLGSTFQSSIGWSPGWGQTVPGLQP